MSEQTNEADVAAVTEVVRAYYDGTMTGDEAKLASAFHPRACIVGTWEGKLDWVTRDEYIAECKDGTDEAGPYDSRFDGVSFEGGTAHVRLGGSTAASTTAMISPSSRTTAVGASSTRPTTRTRPDKTATIRRIDARRGSGHSSVILAESGTKACRPVRQAVGNSRGRVGVSRAKMSEQWRLRHVGLLFLLLASTACASQVSAKEASGVVSDRRPAAADDASRTGLVYAAVVRQLVQVDHGFGTAPSPYRRVYVIDGAVPHAFDPRRGLRRPAHPFDAELKSQIMQQPDHVAPLAFVRSPTTVIRGRTSRSPGHVIDHGVLVTLGPVTWINSRTARVANNRWVAGDNGQWLVYTVELRRDQWRVAGVHGAITIS
ncbi:MAG TPA: nuclear transport factor 2 family protein [Gaiellales bacterium]|nr:nuclear transport factor 2 family protein [Gaiellales bacterium]